MPIYDYVCSSCSTRTEVIHGIDAPAPRFCPACGAEDTLRKVFVSPAVHFKGSGWAKKDRSSSSSSRTKAAASGSSSGEGGKDGGSGYSGDGSSGGSEGSAASGKDGGGSGSKDGSNGKSAGSGESKGAAPTSSGEG